VYMKKKRSSKKVTTIEGLAQLVVGEFARIDVRLDRMEARQDKMDGRLDKTDGRLDRIEARLTNIEEEIRAIRSDIAYIFKRLDALEQAVGHVRGFAKR
jgi:chromosome segregation ATPase